MISARCRCPFAGTASRQGLRMRARRAELGLCPSSFDRSSRLRAGGPVPFFSTSSSMRTLVGLIPELRDAPAPSIRTKRSPATRLSFMNCESARMRSCIGTVDPLGPWEMASPSLSAHSYFSVAVCQHGWGAGRRSSDLSQHLRNYSLCTRAGENLGRDEATSVTNSLRKAEFSSRLDNTRRRQRRPRGVRMDDVAVRAGGQTSVDDDFITIQVEPFSFSQRILYAGLR